MTEKVVGDEFEGMIEKINRIEPCEIDDDFFEKGFGPDVKTEEEARNVHSRKH